MASSEHLRYRPEIDGLRALAVLAVLFYHGGFGFPGGFIGVDIFFVISGFLITSIIWRDLEAGKFSFANFWERRARRIVPAFVVVTAATLAAAWFMLSPLDYADLGRAASAQSVFTANIHYLRHSGYFDGAAQEKPLLHVWSLAVEEQFYVAVPFLFFCVFFFRGLRSRSFVLPLLSLLLTVSFVFSVRMVSHAPMAAFYLLQSRAWELLLGAIVAFLPALPLLAKHRPAREFAGLAGLALILVPVFTYSHDTPFPGLAALPPCLGAALVIFGSGHGATLTGGLLSARPIVFTGLISYSLYLWHWPLLALAKYHYLTQPPAAMRALLLLAAFGCAILSWKFVEVPFRRRQVAASRKAMFTFAALSLLSVFVFGKVCRQTRGFPNRLSPEVQKGLNARLDRAFINELTLDDARSAKFIAVGKALTGPKPDVFFWGDSHAMSALPAFDVLLKERGLTGLAATRSSTAPLADWPSPDSVQKRETREYNQAVFSWINRHKISDVFLIGSWSAYVGKEKDKLIATGQALPETVRKLTMNGSRVWVLLDVPVQPFDVPRALTRVTTDRSDIEKFCARPPLPNELGPDDHAVIAEIEAAGGKVLDPKPRFLDVTKSYYRIDLNGIPLYSDTDHLTTKGAKLVLLPFLRESWVAGK